MWLHVGVMIELEPPVRDDREYDNQVRLDARVVVGPVLKRGTGRDQDAGSGIQVDHLLVYPALPPELTSTSPDVEELGRVQPGRRRHAPGRYAYVGEIAVVATDRVSDLGNAARGHRVWLGGKEGGHPVDHDSPPSLDTNAMCSGPLAP